MPIKNRIAEMQDEIAAWRRDFHEHPELLYDTNRTAAIVAAKLREFGCDEVAEGIGRTGVVGLIRGRSDSNGRVVGIRADMDALPILEATGVPYASKTPGKMHACGHDGHTAMLLGAAKYLAETRNFDGAAAVIFQPAEEGGAGGKAMVEDGLIDRFGIGEIYGMHNSPGHAGRRVRHQIGSVLCGDRHVHHRRHRPRRPCGATPYDGRPDADRLPSRAGPAIDRLPQRRSGSFHRHLGDQLPDRVRRL